MESQGGVYIVECIVPYYVYIGVCGENLMADKPPDEMVWDRWSDPLVVPTRWALLLVSLYRASVWPYGVGVGYT